MIKVVVTGAAGRMGRRIVALLQQAPDLTLAGALEAKGSGAVGRDAGEIASGERSGITIGDDLETVVEGCDVVVDFSAPSAAVEHLKTVANHRRAMVIGTTGLSAADLDQIRSCTGTVPCVLSPNMSVGVNLIFKVIAEMARALGEDYDIEVVEAHHRLKKDAPSGTAMKMAEILAQATNRDLERVGVYSRKGLIGERKRGEIGIQTLRAGDIVGDHTVLFGGMGERVEVTHRAQSRDTFAAGALRAARWVTSRPPGLYSMLDVLGLS